MREIIPLKKDIIFKTIIGKIVNINLDHDYKVKDNLIEGYVLLNGSYKMTEASALEDEFSYKIPFGVSISKRIKKDTIKIDIDDFKYKINKDILSLNIDLEFTCDEEDLIKDDIKENKEEVEKETKEKSIEKETNEEIQEEEKKPIKEIENISNNIVQEEKYYTYKVYIVRENDTIENICAKYNVLIEDIKEYNDLSNIKIGDKIIIPYINE